MIARIVTLSLVLQITAVWGWGQQVPTQPLRSATVSGIVTSSTGDPIAGVHVTLARTDAALGAFADMVAGDHPPGEMRLTGEYLSMMAQEMARDVSNGDAPPQAAAEAAAVASLPIDNIQEMILNAGGSVSIVYKSSPPITTEGQGVFTFENIEPGTYKLIFSANGYARQEYGQRSSGGTGVPIVLGAGQIRNDLRMKISAVGAISGHIRDLSGQPVAGVPVQLVRFAYDETGQKKTQRVAAAQTDDRGEYRLYSLTPGNYYLSAGNPPGQSRPNDFAGPVGINVSNYVSPNRIQQPYSVKYYPGVSDANAASPIEILSGREIEGADLSLSVQQGFRVRGRVIDPRSNQPPPNATISINLAIRDPGDIFSSSYFESRPIYNPADGSFEMRNVSPGTYTLTANLPRSGPQPPADLASLSNAEQSAYFDAQRAADQAALRAIATVTVDSRDVDNVTMIIGGATSISGIVQLDSDNAARAIGLDFLRIQMKNASTQQISSTSQPPKADGSFRLDGVRPGDYQLSVVGMPAGTYLKEAKNQDSDVLNAPLRITGSGSDALRVVISSKIAAVDGVISDKAGNALPGAQAVLIPENRDRTELFRSSVSDHSGHYQMSSVPPGDYRLAAWDNIDPFAYFDPALIRQAGEFGQRIHVDESSQLNLNVKVIGTETN